MVAIAQAQQPFVCRQYMSKNQFQGHVVRSYLSAQMSLYSLMTGAMQEGYLSLTS